MDVRALTVLSTVFSQPTGERATIDAGSKSLTARNGRFVNRET
jgi:D-serine deaminase-like pyridoxal phosphate-dependent protein